jgi:hypothetical protein
MQADFSELFASALLFADAARLAGVNAVRVLVLTGHVHYAVLRRARAPSGVVGPDLV